MPVLCGLTLLFLDDQGGGTFWGLTFQVSSSVSLFMSFPRFAVGCLSPTLVLVILYASLSTPSPCHHFYVLFPSLLSLFYVSIFPYGLCLLFQKIVSCVLFPFEEYGYQVDGLGSLHVGTSTLSHPLPSPDPIVNAAFSTSFCDDSHYRLNHVYLLMVSLRDSLHSTLPWIHLW